MAAGGLSPQDALRGNRGREERERKSVEGGRGGGERHPPHPPHPLFTHPLVASSAVTTGRRSPPPSGDKSVSALQSYWLNSLLPFHYAVQWATFCNKNNILNTNNGNNNNNNNSDLKQSDNNSIKANTRGNSKMESFCSVVTVFVFDGIKLKRF